MSYLSKVLAGVALAIGFAGQAHADAVPLSANGQWSPFDVDSLSALSAGLEWISLDGSPLNFTFTLAGPGTLHVVDAGFSGDAFRVFDNGAALGDTAPSGVNSFPVSVGTNFDLAFSSASFSKAVFALGAGAHSISGLLINSALDNNNAPINATVGAVMLQAVQAVPEPSTWLLVATGLGIAGAFARRRHHHA